jgi:hypothetical protein
LKLLIDNKYTIYIEISVLNYPDLKFSIVDLHVHRDCNCDHWSSEITWNLVPNIGIVGGLLTFSMSLVTLSFLVTTPEVYVPNLGGDFPTPQHGFPYLSGAGRLKSH